jgi:hypothetical protein
MKAMQYLLNIYQPEGPVPPPDVLQRIMRDVKQLVDDARDQGSWVFNGGLASPSSTTVVRFKDGETLMTDGPFAEGKEFIGGFIVVRAPDLDGALAWASRLSRVTGLPIEVRPFRGGEG